MSTNNNNIIINAKSFNFNVNHLKLTPEKLSEWDKRSSNILITSKYFDFFQQSQNKVDVRNNPQDHEIYHGQMTNGIHQEPEENSYLISFIRRDNSNQLIHGSVENLSLSNDLQVIEEKQNIQQDDMSLDDLKDSEYIRNVSQSEMSLQEDTEIVDLSEDCMGYDMQELNNETSAQEQISDPISDESNFYLSNISEQRGNLSKDDSSNFLKTMQNVAPTVSKQKIFDQENTLQEGHHEQSVAQNQERHPTQQDNNINNQEDNFNKQFDKILLPSKAPYEEKYLNPKSAFQHEPLFSNEKYNKMKRSSRLRVSNPDISHFMKTVMPNKKSEFDRDMEEILCDIEAYYEIAQEGQLEVNQQLDYIEQLLDSLNKEFNKYRAKLCDLRQEFCNLIQINVLKESEEWESVFDGIGSNLS